MFKLRFLKAFPVLVSAFLLALIAQHSVASGGGFIPRSTGNFNAPPRVDPEYDRGKAFVQGRKSQHGCTECHEKFKRKALKKLEVPVSLYITNCEIHGEKCYKDLVDLQTLYVIDKYFRKRFGLKY